MFVLTLVGHGDVQADTHQMNLTVSNADFQRYRAGQDRSAGEKEGESERAARTQKVVFDTRFATVEVDGGPVIRLAEMNTHGKTSQSAKRRSFEIHLKDAAKVRIGPVAAEKLFLISMQADAGYISNAIGLKILALSGLSVPQFSYFELVLNGVSQGLYLAFERPVDVIRERLDGVYIARRRYLRLEIEKYEAEKTAISELDFTEALHDILKLHRALSGKELHIALSQHMNVDDYMIWMGLNSLLRNGDFSDEIYFYSRSTSSDTENPYYQIFPWDMDDLFKSRMHVAPLNWLLSGFDSDSLLFNFESGLDRKINRDSFLYREFQAILFRELTEHLTDGAIDQIIDSTRDEAVPYLDIPAVQHNSKKDWINRKGLSKDSVLRLLETRRQTLKAMRRSFLARIASAEVRQPGSSAPTSSLPSRPRRRS